jgi:Metallo-peptidase family M12/K319L-like, PKD domain
MDLFMYASKFTGKILNRLVAVRWQNASWVRLLIPFFFLFCFTFPGLSFSAEKLFTLETPEEQQKTVSRAGPKLKAAIHQKYVVSYALAKKACPSLIDEKSKDIEINLNLAPDLSVVAHKLRVGKQSGKLVWWYGEIFRKRIAHAPLSVDPCALAKLYSSSCGSSETLPRDCGNVAPVSSNPISLVKHAAEPAIKLSPTEIPIDPFNTVTLVRHDNYIHGLIRREGDTYEIIPVENNEYAIIKVDTQKLPREDEPVPADQSSLSEDNNAPSPHRTHSTIRVMVAVTNQARQNDQDIVGRVAEAFRLANEANENSHVAITFENAGIMYPNYDETGTFDDMSKQVRNVNDSQLGAPVHAFREEHRADLVVMLVENDDLCGSAPNEAKKESAFSVVNRKCAINKLSFAHEMGHNLGVSHDIDTYCAACRPFKTPRYIHGYAQYRAAPRWRTIMSYDDVCPSKNCPKINFWSNPSLTWNGLHMGSAACQDVVRRLNERREIVEDFYPPPERALPPVAQATATPASVSGETQVSLDGSASSNPSGGISLLQYEWTQVSGPPPAVTIENSTSAKARALIPAVEQSSSYVFKLVVTNSHSLSDSKTITVSTTPPSVGFCDNIPAWVAKTIYQVPPGGEVSHLGKIYKVAHWTQNQPPDTNSAPYGKPWIYVRDCPSLRR